MPANKHNWTTLNLSIDQQHLAGWIGSRNHHIHKPPIDTLSPTPNSTSNPHGHIG